MSAAALKRPAPALGRGLFASVPRAARRPPPPPPPAPEHAVLPQPGAGPQLAAGCPGAAAALAVPPGAVPLREARGAAVPAAGPAAGALRLVPAGAALLPGARAAAGAAQPAPPRAPRLPPPLLPLLLALLLQVGPPGRAPPPRRRPAALWGRAAAAESCGLSSGSGGSCGNGRSRGRLGGGAGAGLARSIAPFRLGRGPSNDSRREGAAAAAPRERLLRGRGLCSKRGGRSGRRLPPAPSWPPGEGAGGTRSRGEGVCFGFLA